MFVFVPTLQERQRLRFHPQTHPDVRQQDAGDPLGRRLRERGLCEYSYG